MKWLYFLSLHCCLFIFLPALHSQEFQIWPTLTLEKSFSKRYEVGLSYQARVSDLGSRYNSSLVSALFSCKLLPFLKVGIDYRARFFATDAVPTHRFGLSLTGSYSFHKWKVSVRSAYQRRQTYFVSDAISGTPAANFWRNRIAFSFDLPKKFSTQVGVEPFVQFSAYEITLNRVRVSTGVEYAFQKRHIFNLEYLFQPEFKKMAFFRFNHILRVGYCWKIPSWKSKKKNTKKG